MMTPSPDKPGAHGSLRPVALLAAITLVGWMTCVLWPKVLVMLGIYDYGTLYLDSYAVLAALDAVRAGADPHAANHLDPLLRGHVYSDWWLSLRWLGLTREHNFLVGSAWVAAFALTAWATARPRNGREAGWLAALLLSPPVLLAVSRANNDLLIFVLLAGCGLAASAVVWWRPLLAIACLALATGLKYFPATAALAFLWVRPVRRMPAVLLVALLAVVAALASVWTQLDRGRFTVGSGMHVMGAPLWWRDLGWKDTESALPGVLLLVAGAVAFALARVTTGLASRGEPRDRLRAALGTTVLLTCFAVGGNFSYRWIFILWMALWLWRQARDVSLPRREFWAARLGCALVGLCFWLDGALCVVVNLLGPRDQAWIDHVQLVFRQWTQPLHWLLMILLAGWLLEAAVATVREWWAERHAGNRPDKLVR
jgi:hypothetical protein